MGGYWDPETQTTKWIMHVPLEEQLAHYRAHPPSALAGLTATPIELAFPFDGHGEPVNAIFELACPCGGTTFEVYCDVFEDNTGPPIEITCDECEETYTIYDRDVHGYDAVVSTQPRDPGREYEPYTLLGATDVAMPYNVIVRFEFPSDHLGSADYTGREHDLFSWITILARSPETGKVGFLFDDECA